jgi:hypothetical protein
MLVDKNIKKNRRHSRLARDFCTLATAWSRRNNGLDEDCCGVVVEANNESADDAGDAMNHHDIGTEWQYGAAFLPAEGEAQQQRAGVFYERSWCTPRRRLARAHTTSRRLPALFIGI